MLASGGQSLFRRMPKSIQLSSRRYFSNQKETPSSKYSRYGNVALYIVVGASAGWCIHDYYRSYKMSSIALANYKAAPKLHDLYNGSLEWRGKAVKPFSIEDTNIFLRNEQSSHQGPLGSGVKSWDIVRCPSNSICEDNLVTAQCSIAKHQEPWLFWGVFDGHAGWATSATLRESLVPYVVRGLSRLFQSFNGEEPFSQAAIDVTIKSTFQELDDEIMNSGIEALKAGKSPTEILSDLAPGYSGSCAILSMYDPNSKLLRVAVTGDSRAVLGRPDPQSGKYTTEALSVDQTGFNESELARVRAAHPGEKDVINTNTGRTLGIAVTRAFGDGRWKWPLDVIKQCEEKYFYGSPRPGYLTPPYLIVEPVVTTTKIRGEGEFMIIASDGLWEHISSEQAVKLVEMWMLAGKNGTIGKAAVNPANPTDVKGLYDEQKVNEDNFVVEDDNVATHLVRNAFGGKDHETLLGLTGAPSPLSRNARDDITVQVVFFEDNKSQSSVDRHASC